jgi:uncharacterized protein
MNSTVDSKSSKLIFWSSVVLSIAILLFGVIVSRSIKHARYADRSVTVKGFAQKKITSDWGTWSGTLTARANQMGVAYSKIEKDSARLLEFLGKAGIPKEAIEASIVSIEAKYKRDLGVETNVIELYELRQTIKIASSDVRLIERLSKEATFLIKEGIQFQSDSPQFFYSKLDDLKIEMLGAAAKDARDRAEQIAISSKTSLSKLKSSQQGVFQITPIYSSDVSGEGVFDTTSIDKTIRAIVTSTYFVR